MLKIALLDARDHEIVLSLQGRLIGPWVAELERAGEAARAPGRQVVLDLAEVSFVDRDRLALVRRLFAWPVRLRNCSPFVAEQLRGIARCVASREGDGVAS